MSLNEEKEVFDNDIFRDLSIEWLSKYYKRISEEYKNVKRLENDFKE
jgi:hypothetical protein